VPRTLRIVHCFRSPVGGIFRHVRDLTDAQVASGHAVGIICDSTTGGEYEDRLFDAMRDKLALGIHRTPMQRHLGSGDIAAAMRTYGLIRRLKPNILHGHGAKGGAYARLFGTLQAATEWPRSTSSVIVGEKAIARTFEWTPSAPMTRSTRSVRSPMPTSMQSAR